MSPQSSKSTLLFQPEAASLNDIAEQPLQAKATITESELNAFKGKVLKATELKSPEALLPGLIGEYCGGANFDIPSLRRIDPAVSFQWNWGQPAWPEWKEGKLP